METTLNLTKLNWKLDQIYATLVKGLNSADRGRQFALEGYCYHEPVQALPLEDLYKKHKRDEARNPNDCSVD